LFATDIDLAYFARCVAAGIVLWVYRAHYTHLLEAPSLLSIAIGLATAAMWMALIEPPEEGVSLLALELELLTPASRAMWITTRLLGFVVFAPIVEELAFRGYVMRRLQDTDFSRVSLRSWSFVAVGVSSLLFGAIHADMIAGVCAGVLFAVAVLHRGKLIDGIAAHAVANAVLAVIGLFQGAYWLW
jgi:CAAX prenyl protease-like protein